jgi:hypothetical protein
MLRCPSSLSLLIRAFARSNWQDCAPLRWSAQLVVGGLPGVLLCLIIMKLAAAAPDQGNAAHMASIVPLLSASGLADTAAFHRLKFDGDPAADKAPHFRTPDTAPASHEEQRVPKVAKDSAAAVDFSAPRTHWRFLGPEVRAAIDASLAKRKDWQRIVLHGSSISHGNAHLLARYQSAVRGMPQGLACHFVIGNGKGAADGLVEPGERWLKALPAGDIADQGLSGTSISVCLVGDFNSQPPSTAQLEALDELKDYLAIKLGSLAITTHNALTGGQNSCLGAKFPVIETGAP